MAIAYLDVPKAVEIEEKKELIKGIPQRISHETAV